MDNATYEKNWTKPVHLIGRITLIGVCISSFLPVAFLYFAYGIVPPIDWIIKDVVLIAASFGLSSPLHSFRCWAPSEATKRF